MVTRRGRRHRTGVINYRRGLSHDNRRRSYHHGRGLSYNYGSRRSYHNRSRLGDHSGGRGHDDRSGFQNFADQIDNTVGKFESFIVMVVPSPTTVSIFISSVYFFIFGSPIPAPKPRLLILSLAVE